MNHKNKNETTQFLLISLILVLILSVTAFSFLAVFLNRQSTSTIREVSRMYMSGLSDQIARHFETTIGLRLDQMDALARDIQPERIHNDTAQQESLIASAKAREFSYLGFYRVDGTFEMLYGSPLEVTDPEPFMNSLLRGEKKVAVGTDAQDNGVILLGLPTTNPPTEEHSCVAIVAGLPASYISKTLSLEENADHVYSFIIREDGSFVIRTGDATRDSYFDRVRSIYEKVDGKDPELYIQALSEAMAAAEDYSAEVVLYGEPRQLYCTKLSHSEWHLLTCMPYSSLDNIVKGFTTRWTYAVFGICAIVLAVLLLIFARYFRMTKQQMQELEMARKENSSPT